MKCTLVENFCKGREKSFHKPPDTLLKIGGLDIGLYSNRL
jgi:hypothetical protein